MVAQGFSPGFVRQVRRALKERQARAWQAVVRLPLQGGANDYHSYSGLKPRLKP